MQTTFGSKLFFGKATQFPGRSSVCWLPYPWTLRWDRIHHLRQEKWWWQFRPSRCGWSTVFSQEKPVQRSRALPLEHHIACCLVAVEKRTLRLRVWSFQRLVISFKSLQMFFSSKVFVALFKDLLCLAPSGLHTHTHKGDHVLVSRPGSQAWAFFFCKPQAGKISE